MKKIISYIRKQPEAFRRHVLNVVIVVVAFLLVLLWVYLLGSNLTDKDTQIKLSQDLKPFSALKNNLTAGYQNLSNQQ